MSKAVVKQDLKTEALKLALDCVSTLANARDWVGCTPNERWDEDEMYEELCNATICLKKSLSIIQEALAEQPAQQQEPVAWMWRCKPYCNWPEWSVSLKRPADSGCDGHKRTEGYEDVPLYTATPQRKSWVGLTDEQIKLIMDGRGEEGDDDYVKPAFDPFGISEDDLMNFARAIEAAHGITGEQK